MQSDRPATEAEFMAALTQMSADLLATTDAQMEGRGWPLPARLRFWMVLANAAYDHVQELAK